MLKSMQEVLEYGFEILNKVYFGSALPPLVITIMNSKGAYGHFTVGKVWRAEASICMKSTSVRSIYTDRLKILWLRFSMKWCIIIVS